MEEIQSVKAVFVDAKQLDAKVATEGRGSEAMMTSGGFILWVWWQAGEENKEREKGPN